MERWIVLIAVLSLVAIIDASLNCQSWTECDEKCGGGTRECTSAQSMKIKCHLHACDRVGDCGGQADIVWILDDSSSIGAINFWTTKQFVIDTIKGMTLVKDGSRVAVVTYSTQAQTWWQLGDYVTEEDLEEAIWSIPSKGGHTNTADGLLHAQQIFEQSARPGVKHLVVVVTDGASTIQPADTIPRARQMQNLGIEIFAIGVGKSINSKELEAIASEPKKVHWYPVVDHDALAEHAAHVTWPCEAIAASLTTCDEWSSWGRCEVSDGSVCGDGQMERSRECSFYNYATTTDPAVRNDTQYEACNITCLEATCIAITDCDATCDRIGSRDCTRSNAHVWGIPCYGGPCTYSSSCGEFDVILIMDSSSSIGEKHWLFFKQFAIDVIKSFPLSDVDIRFAVVTFSGTANVESYLDVPHSEEKLAEMIWALPWLGGNTNSADALKIASRVASRGRTGTPKHAIYLSDGNSNIQTDETISAADSLKKVVDTVFTAAFRAVRDEELQAISSGARFYYPIENDDSIKTAVEGITSALC